MLIAAAGMMVYMEFGTAIPKNGGEKVGLSYYRFALVASFIDAFVTMLQNYLEFVYRRPKFLATAVFTGYVVLLGKSCPFLPNPILSTYKSPGSHYSPLRPYLGF
jgi:hypothetical protein